MLLLDLNEMTLAMLPKVCHAMTSTGKLAVT